MDQQQPAAKIIEYAKLNNRKLLKEKDIISLRNSFIYSQGPAIHEKLVDELEAKGYDIGKYPYLYLNFLECMSQIVQYKERRPAYKTWRLNEVNNLSYETGKIASEICYECLIKK